MALEKGNNKATDGMAREIYDGMYKELILPMEQQINHTIEVTPITDEPTVNAMKLSIEETKKNMKKLAFSISQGVINHVLSNLEIRGIKTNVKDVKTNIDNTGTTTKGTGTGSTTTLPTIPVATNVKTKGNVDDPRTSQINNDLICKQSNDGLGLVK